MKRIIPIILTLVMLCCSVLCVPVSAATAEKVTTTIEYLDNGDYIETVIAWENSLTRASKTATKTKNYKNADGDVMWSVTVRGTFTYDGTTSTCTAVSRSTTAPASAWSIKSSSCSKSGNTATANATATYTLLGISQDYSMSVKLTCAADGTLS